MDRVEGVVDHEVLDVGPRGLRRPSRHVLIGALVVLLVLAVAAYADARSRAHESRALDACRTELHAAAVSSDQQMLAVATTTHGPLAPTSGAGFGLAGLLARSAQQLLPDAEHADAVCRRVSVRPWHFSLKARRDATTAYAGALASTLRAVAADGRTPYLDNHRLRSLRQAADLAEFGGAS